MKSEVRTIKEFLGANDRSLKIPVFQRNYDWKLSNCKKLFTDIVVSIQTNDGGHFINMIIDQSDSKEMDTIVIIDGQQRVTTVTIALKAIYDLLDKNDEEQKRLAEKITRRYLINEYKETDKLRLHPIESDADAFAEVMSFTDVPLYQQKNPNIDVNSHIYVNYMYFVEAFRNENKNRGIGYDEFIEAMENLQINELRLGEGDDAQKIYESANSTGLDLTPADLIRNYMLMPLSLPSQEKLYRNYLQKIEDILGSDNLTEFLRYYLIMCRRSDNSPVGGKKISDKNLYDAWKIQFPNSEESIENRENDFRDMKRFAEYYKKCLIPQEGYDKLDREHKALFALFQASKQKAASIIVMYLYSLQDDGIIEHEQLMDILDVLVSYEIRSKICGNRGLFAQTSSLLISRLNTKKPAEEMTDEFIRGLCSFQGNSTFQNDVAFKNAIELADIYRNRALCKYMLYALEENREHSKELPSMDEPTIEHIMPQTLSPEWQTYLTAAGDDVEESGKYLHTIGNLTLTSYNSELHNDMFDKKKNEYKESNFQYTKDLAEEDKWLIEDIQKRAHSLAQKCCSIWTLPQEYQERSNAVSGTEYVLYDDPTMFTGAKPSSLFIMGDEYDVNTWKEILATTLTEMKEYDEESFDRVARSREDSLSSLVFSYNKPESVDWAWEVMDNYWYVGNNSTRGLLESLRVLVAAIDEDMLAEITFVVR